MSVKKVHVYMKSIVQCHWIRHITSIEDWGFISDCFFGSFLARVTCWTGQRLSREKGSQGRTYRYHDSACEAVSHDIV